jgi:vanillate O-demethylase monooxygenase subunit
MQWLKNVWQVAAFAHEVKHELFARRINDEAVLLFRTSDGSVAALADRCAHRALPLSMGTLVGDTVQCGYHGLCFARNGSCVSIPGQAAIPSRAHVRQYPIIERHGLIWIWMGDSTRAEADRVPDVFWTHSADWACCSGYHHINADYRLLNDNLLDLSHETFVHKETIGNRAVAESPVHAKTVDGGKVHVERLMSNVEPPPLYVTASGFHQNIDRWHKSIYEPPGYVLIENWSKAAGAPIATAKPRRVINFMTPETGSSTHYFWIIARGYQVEDADLTELIRQRVVETFDQDKVILEAQQRSLGPDPNAAFPVTIHLDAGPILGRRVLAAAIEAEQRVPALTLN